MVLVEIASLPPRRIAWATIAILLATTIFAYIDRQIIALMVEPIKQSFGASDFEISLLQGVAFGLFFAIFGLPMGWLVDRYPRRLIIYVGMTLWSIAAAGCGVAGSFAHLLLARFGVGIGEAALAPATYSMVTDLFPAKRLGLVFGIIGTGTTIGASLAFVAGGALITHFQKMGPIILPLIGLVAPWQIVFLLTGLAGLPMALLLFAIPEPLRRREAVQEASSKGVLAYLLSHRRYYSCHFIGFGLVAMLAYGSAAWLPSLLIRTYGFDIGHVGLIMGGIGLVVVPGFIFSGWVADRWYAHGRTDAHFRYLILVCLIGAAVALVAFHFSTAAWLTIGAYAIVAFLQPFTGPAVAHLQLATPAKYRGRVSALYVLVLNLMGMSLGPPSVAFLTDFIFHDPAQLRSSLAVMYVSVALLAVCVFALGLRPAREIIAARQAGER